MTVTVKNILERVEAAGLPEKWVRHNLLPHWWDKDCDEAADHNPNMMAILEVTLMRTLGVDCDELRDEDAELTIKLDYVSKALLEALKQSRRATHLGLLVHSEGSVTGMIQP